MADDFKPCSVPGCNGNAHSSDRGAGGYCCSHYKRWRRHGDPLAGRTPRGALLRFYESAVLPFEGQNCLIWPYTRTSDGYASMHIDGKSVYIHRLLCERFHGPAPSADHEVAHSCGKGCDGCVNWKHLRWATHAENNGDKISHGSLACGESVPSAKLTDEIVRAIRQDKVSSNIALARRYNVANSQISMVRNGLSWRHVV